MFQSPKLVPHRTGFVTSSVSLLMILLFATAGLAYERIGSFSIGPSWPRALLSSDRPTSWNAEAMYGIMVDRTVAFGITSNFLWNTQSKEKNSNNQYQVITSHEYYMYPVSGFILFDPFYKRVIHPAFRLELGYNSLRYFGKDTTTTPAPRADGYYFGLYTKLAVDANYDIGKHSAFFTGCSYQWANTRTAEHNNSFSRLDMSSFGVQIGFRFLL